MTTTPITPERLREIERLRERAKHGPVDRGSLSSSCRELLAEAARLKDGCDEAVRQRNAAIAVSEERRAEVARLEALCTDSAQSYCRALDRQRAELEAAQAEVARLQGIGRALELNCCELTEQRDVYRDRVQQLTETARAASENWMAACKQRDEARVDVDLMRVECNDAADTDTELYATRTRIAALETALREACGYIDPMYCDDGTTTPTKDRLLSVAGAVESRTR